MLGTVKKRLLFAAYVVLMTAGVLAVFWSARPSSALAQSDVLARWVQVVPRVDAQGNGTCVMQPGSGTGGETAPEHCPYDFLVRAVLPAAQADCPELRVSYDAGLRSLAMTARANPYRWGFGGIKVCQARIPNAVGDRPLSVALPGEAPIPLTARWQDQGGPGTIAVIGDTGCRASNKQICNSENWPFADLVRKLAPAGQPAMPDLAILVGDFMYVKFDAWEMWKAEFFDPAAPLLRGAPWLMVRGNHERCGEFGDAPLGYYLFFDIDPAEDRSCHDDGELTATFAIDLSPDLRVIVGDSATAYADDIATPRLPTSAYTGVKEMIGQVKHLAAGRGNRDVWFTTHVPVYALEVCSQTMACETNGGSAMMQAAWQEGGMSRAGVDVILAAHQHLFQIVEPGGGEPLQIISGAGGVNLDSAPYAPVDNQGCVDVTSLNEVGKAATVPTYISEATMTLKVCSNRNFGYVLAEPHDGEFRFTFKPLD